MWKSQFVKQSTISPLVHYWACAHWYSNSSSSRRGPSNPQMGHSSASVTQRQQRAHPGWFSAMWPPPSERYSETQRALQPEQATYNDGFLE